MQTSAQRLARLVELLEHELRLAHVRLRRRAQRPLDRLDLALTERIRCLELARHYVSKAQESDHA